jgi:hypothetical protein
LVVRTFQDFSNFAEGSPPSVNEKGNPPADLKKVCLIQSVARVSSRGLPAVRSRVGRLFASAAAATERATRNPLNEKHPLVSAVP